MIHTQDADFTLIQADVLDGLGTLEDGSVHCVVTSPPYWGLRDYGTGAWVGGDEDCDHEAVLDAAATAIVGTDGFSATNNAGRAAARVRAGRGGCVCGATRQDQQLGLEATPDLYVARMVEVFREVWRVLRADGTCWVNLGSSYWSDPAKGGSGPNGKNEERWSYGRASRRDAQPSDTPCTEPPDSPDSDFASHGLCDGCAGSPSLRRRYSNPPPPEWTWPDEQTSRDTGNQGSAEASLDASPPAVQESTTPQSSRPLQDECLRCANCGASLPATRSSSPDDPEFAHTEPYTPDSEQRESESRTQGTDASGTAWVNYTFKPKDMVPIPWMVAMALQADGWYLRSDIIWSKPNPMPESVTDRPTKSHEYVFLLSKEARYFFDQEAVREPMAPASEERYGYAFGGAKNAALLEANKNGIGVGTRPFGMREMTNGRNVRSVWDIATQPYPEAHFATYPEELVRRCVLAGTSERGCCPVCGKPWEREVERGEEREQRPSWSGEGNAYGVNGGNHKGRTGNWGAETRSVGWKPACNCRTLTTTSSSVSSAERSGTSRTASTTTPGLCAPSAPTGTTPDPVPCTVLDPFLGSGTTAYVARKHGRRSIGIELNSAYCDLAARRLQQQSLFSEVAVEDRAATVHLYGEEHVEALEREASRDA